MTAQDPAAEVKALRAALGLSQAALAKWLGCHTVTISRWERGQSPPHPAALALLRRQAAEGRPAGTRARQRDWTYEEDARLINDGLPPSSDYAVASELGRTVGAVRQRRRRLRLKEQQG